ncbi:hypothetical protein EV560_106346 [Bosea sp. BK604]|nr:hypothetical protein EV560_106346 [Bosea sp. BK604]
MIVLAALMRVLGAMVVAVVVMIVVMMSVVMAMVIMRMVMAAAGAVSMRVLVLVIMAVIAMRVPMIMFVMRIAVIVPAAAGRVMGVMLMTVVVTMIVPVVVMPVMIMAVMIVSAILVAMIIGAALGLERALDLAHRATLAADHLGQHMVVLDIDRVGGDLGRGVAVADMPGDAHQAQRVLGADLEQALRRRLDQDEAAILKLDGIAIVQRGRLVEIEQDVEPAIALERDAAAVAVLMVERQRLDDLVLLDRGLAGNGGGAQHDREPVLDDQRRSTDRGSITSITGGSMTQAPATLRKLR